MNKQVYILILEDNAALGEMLRNYIAEVFPETLPLVARSIAEAHVLNYQYEFSVYLVDFHLPDGSGAGFISDVKTVAPESKFLIITGLSREDVKSEVERLGRVSVLYKPFDILNVARELQYLLPLPSPSADTGAFRGSLRQLRLVDLIQVKCLGHDTCQLYIERPDGSHGIISFREGAIVHAEAGPLRGNAAFNEILTWKNGVFQERSFEAHEDGMIQGSWEVVLMEAVRFSDEFNSVRVA